MSNEKPLREVISEVKEALEAEGYSLVRCSEYSYLSGLSRIVAQKNGHVIYLTEPVESIKAAWMSAHNKYCSQLVPESAAPEGKPSDFGHRHCEVPWCGADIGHTTPHSVSVNEPTAPVLPPLGVTNADWKFEFPDGGYNGPRRRREIQLLAEQEKTAALRELCAAVYQFCGTIESPVRFLDTLSNAAHGEPFDVDGLLPYPKEDVDTPNVQQPPSLESIDLAAALIRIQELESCTDWKEQFDLANRLIALGKRAETAEQALRDAEEAIVNLTTPSATTPCAVFNRYKDGTEKDYCQVHDYDAPCPVALPAVQRALQRKGDAK